MKNKKIIFGILSTALIVFGIFFSLLPHDMHEFLTFGANMPHFLHFIMGFAIIVAGLLIIAISIRNETFNFGKSAFESMKMELILNKKKILAVASIMILALVISKIMFPTEAKAQTEFDRMKEAAKYCTNPTSTDPKCLESFNEIRMGTQSSDPQKTAQEKIGITGKYADDGFDPMQYLTAWNFNNLPKEERSKYYKETKRPDGSLLREYWIYAEDSEIEIAPGVFFPAWTYNGQVPAPTIRATEGDRIRIYFTNKGTKPHTMHFHGFHPSSMDGSMPEDFIYPGGNFTYEFDADPFGVHLFHCHSVPLKQHISKGLYGAYIVDPKNDTRPKADREMVMVMNAFDTTLDGENEVYAVNTKAFYYAMNPIQVKKDELIRIYLINIVEFDPINSFHLHATFFDEYSTGTKLEPDAYTDITSMVQGERSILDVSFKYPGMYMFHAHVSEFAELGWMGFFEVTE